MKVKWQVVDLCEHTKDDEASVRVCGPQRILGGAAVHGAIELSRHSLQNQLLALPLRAAIQQAAPHSCPGEQRLWKHLILFTPQIHVGHRQKQREEKADEEGVMACLSISDNR